MWLNALIRINSFRDFLMVIILMSAREGLSFPVGKDKGSPSPEP